MKRISTVIVITAVALLLGATFALASADMSGKVIETMDSGGYTYVQIESRSGKIWAAVPQTSVKVGQKVTIKPGAPMANFTSKTLGRTFKTIIFSPGLDK